MKGISWTSHHVNLIKKEQLRPYYLGINPRGLVPTLIHDGEVIIESNDILIYLESAFPTPCLLPAGDAASVSALLQAEDELHLDIRALTMRFVFPTFLSKRPEREITQYARGGYGTVAGEIDLHREREMTFWRDMNVNGGITDTQATQAFHKFRVA
ncbi:MAG: glutathione S-transferase N-terminal domain-containing protein, partial [Pseudomonadota bacterium]